MLVVEATLVPQSWDVCATGLPKNATIFDNGRDAMDAGQLIRVDGQLFGTVKSAGVVDS